MPIYTKTGDDGTTSLVNGKRILKSDLIVEAYGSTDELSSLVGLAITMVKDGDNKLFLTNIQKDLQAVTSLLAGARGDYNKLETSIKKIEQKIDIINKGLPKHNRFILPQGSPLSCWFHILRTVCRRCERAVVRSFFNKGLKIVRYFNRLSDLFFVFARLYNREKEIII